MIERILLLIRNLLHVSSDPPEEKVGGHGHMTSGMGGCGVGVVMHVNAVSALWEM